MSLKTRVLLAGAAASAALAAPASAASPDVVISQVYGGGGNSGATLTNDYIELQNRGSSPVDVSGWSVQYASAAGATWQTTPLSGTIAPGARYLVAEAAGSGGTTPLPTPDATGSIPMSATAGKVALVTNATALNAVCGSACAGAAGVRDFIGYGNANNFEGAAAPALSNTTAALRGAGADTDNNAADFTAGDPNPGGGGSEPPPPPPAISAKIRDIQGAAQVSPLNGERVKDVTGIVTAVTTNRYWIQDPQPDDNPATSEAIVVFTNASPTVAVGDAVTVAGTVDEFRPGGASTGNLLTTEIVSPTATVTSSGNPLPEAQLVGPGGRVPPSKVIDDDANGSVETGGTFDAATDGIDFWESMESMRVRVDDPQVVGPTNDFGETPVVAAGASTRTPRGGIVIAADDYNPERVVLSDLFATIPAANTGDRYAGAVTGILDYNFGLFTLQPATSPTRVDRGLKRERTAKADPLEMAVATFNVENLSPADPPAKFQALAEQIVSNLAAPDIVGLEEVQDNTGPTNDGVVAADRTLQLLTDAIVAAGGPRYRTRSIDPQNGTDGGQPGGNIRQAFLYRTDRGVSFVDRAGGDATTPVAVSKVGGAPRLSASPGRIDPANAAFASSRKPLVGEFRRFGQTIYVVANHFNSKGGDQPLFGRFQPPARPSETQRHQQAALVRGFVDQVRAIDRDANIVVLGDINDFEFSETANILTAGGALVDLPRTLPAGERYTYVFEGNSQVLDHILLSSGMAKASPLRCLCLKTYEYDIVHANSEFTDQISDHDPQVARIRLNLR